MAEKQKTDLEKALENEMAFMGKKSSPEEEEGDLRKEAEKRELINEMVSALNEFWEANKEKCDKFGISYYPIDRFKRGDIFHYAAATFGSSHSKLKIESDVRPNRETGKSDWSVHIEWKNPYLKDR